MWEEEKLRKRVEKTMMEVRGNYILNEKGDAVECHNFMYWARWFERSGSERILGRTRLTSDIYVSTVFLGIDHSHGYERKPVLWETIVFGGPMDEELERYASRKEAITGHLRMVDKVRESIGDKQKMGFYLSRKTHFCPSCKTNISHPLELEGYEIVSETALQ